MTKAKTISDLIRAYVFLLESPTNLLLINLLLTNHLPRKNHQNKQTPTLLLHHLYKEKKDHVLLFEVVATDHTEEALILPLHAEDTIVAVTNVAVTTMVPFATQSLASVLVKAEFTPLF
jgi:hypothetical protein